MKKVLLLLLFISSLCIKTRSQEIKLNESSEFFKDMVITRVSDYAYVYTYKMPIAGNYSANGMFYIVKDKALLIDTPGEDKLTDSLINCIKNKFKVTIEGIVITHWHMGDRLGGLNAAHKQGIKSYSTTSTINEARKRKLPLPQTGFEKTMIINVGTKKVELYYPGPGHSLDNSVVWFVADKVLFGGCLIKDSKAGNLGNTEDADLKAWPASIKKVEKKYEHARIVVPGHGLWDNAKLTFRHNLDLMKSK